MSFGILISKGSNFDLWKIPKISMIRLNLPFNDHTASQFVNVCRLIAWSPAPTGASFVLCPGSCEYFVPVELRGHGSPRVHARTIFLRGSWP